jgi:hypothetical protein
VKGIGPALSPDVHLRHLLHQHPHLLELPEEPLDVLRPDAGTGGDAATPRVVVNSVPVAVPAVTRGVFAAGNQTSDPQCGQGASALGHDGDSPSQRRQTGQRLGCPSGVREEIVIWPPNGLTRPSTAAAITDFNLQGDIRDRGLLLRKVRRAISLRGSDPLAPCIWHF